MTAPVVLFFPNTFSPANFYPGTGIFLPFVWGWIPFCDVTILPFLGCGSRSGRPYWLPRSGHTKLAAVALSVRAVRGKSTLSAMQGKGETFISVVTRDQQRLSVKWTTVGRYICSGYGLWCCCQLAAAGSGYHVLLEVHVLFLIIMIKIFKLCQRHPTLLTAVRLLTVRLAYPDSSTRRPSYHTRLPYPEPPWALNYTAHTASVI